MLQKLNERIQGVVAWLVVILIAITFTLFGVDYYMQSHQSANVKVTVNGQPISNQLFETNYRRARSQQDLAQLTAADDKRIQSQVLDQMVTNEVIVQAARKYGFEVTAAQANDAIVNIPQFQEDGHFSKERYQHALSGALFTPETFQNEVRQGMLLNQQRFAFMSSSFALPNEIKQFVRLYMQTRDYEYLTVPSERFEKEAHISPEQVKGYYEQHKSEFMAPEQVSIDYITLSMQDIRSKTNVTPEMVKHYYDENQNNYLIPAQWQVAHILFAVPDGTSKEEEDKILEKAKTTYAALQKNPDQFNAYVKTTSDDKLSVVDNGVMPWMIAGKNDYDKILSGLTKPGQISAPERTKMGYELFKLIAYKPVGTKPFNEVESTIKEQLTAEMAQAEYAQALEQLTDISYQSPDSLQPVEDALKLKINQSESFSRLGGSTNLTQNQQIIDAAFSHDVLELSNNSDPIQLDNDAVVVLRVKEHFVSKQQSLNTVLDQIMTLLTKKNADDKAKEVGSNLLNAVEDEKQKDIINDNQLKWVAVSQATRDNDKSHASINELAFNLVKPDSRDGVVLQNGDYVIVKLKRINDGKLSSLDKEHRDSLVQQIEASYGMMDYDLYVSSLVSKAKIEKH